MGLKDSALWRAGSGAMDVAVLAAYLQDIATPKRSLAERLMRSNLISGRGAEDGAA